MICLSLVKYGFFQDRIALHDIAQKYKLTEEMVKSLIKDINHSFTTHWIKRLRIEALLDGKLTVDQVVAQEHVDGNDEYPDLDGMNKGALKEALERLKAGDDRSEIIDDIFNDMELL